MKRMIDRTFAVDFILKDKKFYLLSAGAAPEEQYYCDISTIHVVIGAISLVGMVLLFISDNNSKN